MSAVPPPIHPSDPRVALALERTFLAWVRTSLALMAFGVVVVRFSLLTADPEFAAMIEVGPPRVPSVLVGLALIGVGTFAVTYSAVRFRSDLRSIERGHLPHQRSTHIATITGMTLAAVGVLTIAYFVLRLGA